MTTISITELPMMEGVCPTNRYVEVVSQGDLKIGARLIFSRSPEGTTYAGFKLRIEGGEVNFTNRVGKGGGHRASHYMKPVATGMFPPYDVHKLDLSELCSQFLTSLADHGYEVTIDGAQFTDYVKEYALNTFPVPEYKLIEDGRFSYMEHKYPTSSFAGSEGSEESED